MQRYFEFSGRSSRSDFRLYVRLYLIIYVIAWIIDAVLFGALSGEGLPIVTMIVALAHFIPSIAGQIRRLHDTDRSGWWFLLIFVPFGAIVLIVFYCFAGTPGDNRFGAPQ